ncbi:supervillin, putative [Schistosoma mansoni]|uniref:supervillin, putative n=1 Tax=Schistosoma mansoni TaxID=6183 RepID=UPI00022C8285|nr:supervillin, putative [Schistosoma mansoni]|eukprot:XP_018646783.1 supervillin, putative [Schistosoma mansoni]
MASYTLSDLQQRPLPPELDATCLETYLDEKTFEETFSMSREDFNKLPIWKQTEMKKYLGLF